MSVLAFVESNTTGTGALLVERARMLGLRPVLLTRDPGRYPFAAAGEVEVVEVETMDRGLVVTRCRALAAEEPLAGVTSSSDYFIETAAAAARTLALPAPDPDAIRRCREKDAQRLCLRRAGVPVPRFGVAASGDVAATLAEEQLAGVTSSSDYFIETAAAAARTLALPAPDPDAIRRCREKDAQRLCLRRAGVPVPRFGVATSGDVAATLAEELGLPVVVKPTAGSGSVGVRLCADPAEAAAHGEWLLAETTNERGLPVPRRVLVEQYVVGLEYSAEVLDGHVVGLTAKHLGALPEFVELGHDFPAPLEREEAGVLWETAARALDAVGLRRGPAHVELRLGADGPVVVEVNARLAGGFIPELVREAIGVDLLTELVRSAVGAPPHLEPRRSRPASIRFLTAPCDGVLTAVEGLEEVRRLPYVVDVRLYHAVGDEVARTGDFRERIGHVLAAGPHAPAVAAVADGAVALIRPVVHAEQEAAFAVG